MSSATSVCSAASQRFSKTVRPSVQLVEGQGIEGDAHAGAFIRHRYLARYRPEMCNDRQVHLLQAELFDELKMFGYDLGLGELGENITTRGINLLDLSLGSRLRLGRTALVELTGLRTPCGYIDKYQKGLKRQMIAWDRAYNRFAVIEDASDEELEKAHNELKRAAKSARDFLRQLGRKKNEAPGRRTWGVKLAPLGENGTNRNSAF